MIIERTFLPPSTALDGLCEPICNALAALEQATADAKRADVELVKLQRSGRAVAERLDADELAQALEQDRPAPKAKHVEQFDRQLSGAQRQASATAIVRERRWADVEAAFREHGDELRDAVEQRFETLRLGYLQALDALVERHSALATAFSLKAFCENSNGGARYRPTATYPAVHQLPVRREQLQDDDRLPLAHVFALLHKLGGPVELPEGLNPDAYRSRDGGHVNLDAQRRLGLHSPGVVFEP